MANINDYKDILETTGQIAQYVRLLTGGKDLNGFTVHAVDIEHAAPVMKALKQLTDDYDRKIINLMENQKQMDRSANGKICD